MCVEMFAFNLRYNYYIVNHLITQPQTFVSSNSNRLLLRKENETPLTHKKKCIGSLYNYDFKCSNYIT